MTTLKEFNIIKFLHSELSTPQKPCREEEKTPATDLSCRKYFKVNESWAESCISTFHATATPSREESKVAREAEAVAERLSELSLHKPPKLAKLEKPEAPKRDQCPKSEEPVISELAKRLKKDSLTR